MKLNKYITFFSSLTLVFFVFYENVDASVDGEIVGGWAEKFGRELWELGQIITKAPEIKSRYVALNAQVEKKDITTLLSSVVENVSRMLSRKMDAIKCIAKAAEDANERYEYNATSGNFTYYNALCSNVTNGIKPNLKELQRESNASIFRIMDFNQDTHFYNLSVNTTHSAVQVPIYIDDLGRTVNDAIQWSEELDTVFVKNYNSDPALSWQYFGSSTGFLRFYPAMTWPLMENTTYDLFDSRLRSWYIEAVTCSKDVVILVDNSGSMTGMRSFIAHRTVSTILETFSNNDFINIFSFNETAVELISCFKDMLVQATRENLKIFDKTLEELSPEGNANFTEAFTKAFTLLEDVRSRRNCSENVTECNQAIMLVTDGVPGNLTEVFEAFNRFENHTHVPVRIFTYLVGKEVTKVREIQWLACLNRGYYAHIRSLEEITEQVLKYIPVIARPLILQATEHPISWTHAYIDKTSEVKKNNNSEKLRLMTSVAIPAFDRREPAENETKFPNILGVAGTDVPVEDIDKLTLPYKLGVNAYAFVVSNNGYVLLHPDLRPMTDGNIRDNYESIDLTEVEQLDDDLGPRNPGSQLMDLRQALVDYVTGSISNVSVKTHYDNMHRVHKQLVDYYYSPLHGTPFSLGLAIPHGYGQMWIKVGDELRKNLHMGVNITNFFQGNNWKVHPEWVYCKYHYLEGHEFSNSEDELIHFLNKMSDLSKWKWSQQYEADPLLDDILWGPNGTLVENTQNCSRKLLHDDDYYCNQELMLRLVFDAKVTESFTNWTSQKWKEEELFHVYNTTLRFVATMSGLTRWQYIRAEDDDISESEFGDYHDNAIDETWYKSAVFQHEVDPDSFVYAVTNSKEDKDIVTASHAIFPRDGGKEAPGSVVGFQFKLSYMFRRFMDITNEGTGINTIESCVSNETDCYVIDSSGYIILSEHEDQTGVFFGDVIEDAVVEQILNMEIFTYVTIYDYQALCFTTIMTKADGCQLLNPLNYFKWFTNWVISKIVWLFVETNLYSLYDSNFVYGSPTESEEEVLATSFKPKKLRKGQNQEDDDYFNRKIEPEYEDVWYSCEKQVDLYILNQTMFIGHNQHHEEIRTNNCISEDYCTTFFVRRIPHTNLLLVVVKSIMDSSVGKKTYFTINSSFKDIEYDNNTECNKTYLNHFTRRRLSGCYTDQTLEMDLDMCGDSNIINISYLLFFISLIISNIFVLNV